MLLSEEEAEEKAAAAEEEEEAAAAAEASTPLNLWWGYLPATPTPLPASSLTAAAVGGLTACVMVLTRLVSSFPTAPRSSTCSSNNRLDPDPPPPLSPERDTPPRPSPPPAPAAAPDSTSRQDVSGDAGVAGVGAFEVAAAAAELLEAVPERGGAAAAFLLLLLLLLLLPDTAFSLAFSGGVLLIAPRGNARHGRQRMSSKTKTKTSQKRP